MITVKNATVSEIPLIRKIAMQVWPQTYIPIIGEEQVAYMLGLFYNNEVLKKQFEDLQHIFIICYYDEYPAGFASYSEIGWEIFKLHKLYILPEVQGKGIGCYMIGHIVAFLKKQNAKELRLNVNRYNHNARLFYEKIGFHHILDEDIDIGNGYFMNDHVLGLVIPQNS
jgi:GNAT superfamily N-acetyltransferase